MADLQEYQAYLLDALEVVNFKLVRNRKELEDGKIGFRPLMAHQHFGGNETIFGYESLQINIFYTAGPLHIYLGLEHGGKIEDITNGDLQADDVVASIVEKLPAGCYFMNLAEFAKTLDKAVNFKPFGEKLTEFQNGERIFEIYISNCTSNAFLNFFERLQTFVMWFVDAASYIDVDDEKWTYFICYERYKNDDGKEQFATVGYATCYEFWAYPDQLRPRISQMLVLPPFQKQKVGATMLSTIYKHYQTQKRVVDITVEDPSEEFQRMRNFMDVIHCLSLAPFAKEKVMQGFSKEMVKAARSEFKINARQCRIVYEIIRLYYTDVNDEDEYASYSYIVKSRLFATTYKQLLDLAKLEKAKINTEFVRKALPTKEERIAQLNEDFEKNQKEYNRVLDKVREAL